MTDRAFPAALAGALIVSIAVAFSPRYWPIAIALGSISLLGIAWAVTTRGFSFDARSTPALIAVTLLSACGPLQLALHRTMAPWLTGRASLNWLGFGLAFLLASQVLASERACHVFLDILLRAATIFAILAVIQLYALPPRVYGIFATGPQTVGTFLYKNQFAAMLELAAPIALWRALRGRESPVFGMLFFAVLFAAAVASASRAGVILMGLEFVCALGIALRQRRISPPAAALLAGSLLILLVAASSLAGPAKILAHFQERSPYTTRRQLLDSTVRMIRERPWFGSGLGTWRQLYPRFATFDNALVANQAHNDWAQWAAEAGIPFSALMLALVVSTARAAFSTTWGLGVFMVMLHSLIDYPTREPALGLLWFALAGALIASANYVERSRPPESLTSARTAEQRRCVIQAGSGFSSRSLSP
jgi:O-antigen ligase